MVDDWITAIDNNNLTGTVFLDLSKAFDLVDHEKLFQKLKLYHFHNSSLEWFKSYLEDRSQKVAISGMLSKSRNISIGVPQGSVLGPLLFIIFINDLPLCTHHSTTNMFADDSTLTATGKTTDEIATNLTADLNNVQEWCAQNSMSLNVSKTKAMLFSSKTKAINETSKIHIGSQPIDYSSQEKLLGVTVDSSLNWSEQIDKTIKKCNSLLFLLGRIKVFLSIPNRKLFYNAYILPHIDYCCTIWGNCSKDLTDQIIKFQKKAARLILDKDFDIPS